MFDLTWNQLFGLAGFAALIGVFGTVIGHFLKEVVFARWFEHWKLKRAARNSLNLLVAPMFHSARELLGRLHEIYDTYPTNFLSREVLKAPLAGLESNTATDPHFRRYKCISTLYRFCAFWGWCEVFRRDVVAVQSSLSRRVEKIEASLHAIRGDIADGHLNFHEDWETWKDRLVFREELRAVGECMIKSPPSQGICGYATFSELLSTSPNHEWMNVCIRFFFDLDAEKDFRRERLLRMIVHLHELLEILDKSKIPPYIADRRRRYSLQATAP